MRVKPVYKLKIDTLERTFTIYKFSGYTQHPINVVSMGLAYDDKGEYSTKLVNNCAKYDIDTQDSYLVDSFKELCTRVYVDEKMNKLKNKKVLTPKRALEYCKRFFEEELRKKKI